MLRKLGAAIYRGLFWTYERGTWQYDIMVALILAFIFLTPRAWFNDQPKPPAATGVVLLSSNEQEKVYQIHAALLDVNQENRAEEAIRKGAERVLRSYTGKPVRVTQIKLEKDARGEVVSYEVWVRE